MPMASRESFMATWEAVEALASTRSGSEAIRLSSFGEWAPPRLTASPRGSPKSSQASSAEAQSVPPASSQTSEKLPKREATRCGSLATVICRPSASVRVREGSVRGVSRFLQESAVLPTDSRSAASRSRLKSLLFVIFSSVLLTCV